MGLATASIVGYTNAGKSSLLNALTHKDAYVANELFATLDTRVAKLWLPGKSESGPSDFSGPSSPSGQGPASQDLATSYSLQATSSPWDRGHSILHSDTIGFIQDLPLQLIDAFRSTLEETVNADLILHVIDATDLFIHEKIAEVEDILGKLHV